MIKYIFIIPYRDRLQHKSFFMRHMKYILEDIPEHEYKIWFIHQLDNRPFNRGALKNIGLLVARQIYKHYKDIIFVFNDVDTVPYKKNLLNYKTINGIVKHFYGFDFALGGIFSITGRDFEKINGFPNFWSWGFEDNCVYNRCIKHGLYVDRNSFYKIGDHNILQLFDGVVRNLSVNNIPRVKQDTGSDGINSISNLNFYIENEMVQIYSFQVPIDCNSEFYADHDIRNGSRLTTKQFKPKNNNNQKRFLM